MGEKPIKTQEKGIVRKINLCILLKLIISLFKMSFPPPLWHAKILWVVVFQPKVVAIEQLGYVTIGYLLLLDLYYFSTSK